MQLALPSVPELDLMMSPKRLDGFPEEGAREVDSPEIQSPDHRYPPPPLVRR